MNAIDKLRERDTVEAAIIVSEYDNLVEIPENTMARQALLNLAEQIVGRLAQDEEPDDIPF